MLVSDRFLKQLKRIRRRTAAGPDGGVPEDRVIAEVLHTLSQGRRLRVIYVSAVDRQHFQPVREIVPGEGILAVACWVDEVRLIDNVPY